MNLLQAILLGAVQGISVFLPISASGHLAIVNKLLGVTKPDAWFSVFLQLGALIAALLYYRKDLALLMRSQKSDTYKDSRRTLWFLVIAALPLALYPFLRYLLVGLYTNFVIIALAFAANGLVLFFANRFEAGEKDVRAMTLPDALIIGAGQLLAVIPGFSRTGMALSAGQYRNLDRDFALRLSMLLAIPALSVALLLSLFGAIGNPIIWRNLPIDLAAMVAAGLFGYGAIRLLHSLCKRDGFESFAYYCWGASALTLFLALIS